MRRTAQSALALPQAPSDLQQVAERRQRAGDRHVLERPAGDLLPVVDRDGLDPIAALGRKREDLDVEAPSEDGLAAEQVVGDRPAKRLEAALRVVDLEAQRVAHEAVPEAGDEPAQTRVTAPKIPDADDHVDVLVHELRHRLQVMERSGEVGVHEHPVSAPCLLHAEADISPLALRLARVDDPEHVERSRLRPRERRRVVVATSHHDEHLHGPEVVRVQVVRQRLEGDDDPAGFVVRRDDDGQVGRRAHGPRRGSDPANRATVFRSWSRWSSA